MEATGIGSPGVFRLEAAGVGLGEEATVGGVGVVVAAVGCVPLAGEEAGGLVEDPAGGLGVRSLGIEFL